MVQSLVSSETVLDSEEQRLKICSTDNAVLNGTAL